MTGFTERLPARACIRASGDSGATGSFWRSISAETNFLEPDGSLSDTVIVDATISFVSDDNPGGLTPVPGAIQLTGETQSSAFSVIAVSDGVPEPSALCLLPAGVFSLGWTLLRRRRR